MTRGQYALFCQKLGIMTPHPSGPPRWLDPRAARRGGWFGRAQYICMCIQHCSNEQDWEHIRSLSVDFAVPQQ